MAILLAGFAHLPVLTFIPLYFQGVLGTSATLSGNFMTPMMLSMAVGSFLSGQALSRAGGYYRLQSTFGFILMVVGLFLLSRMTVETSYATALRNIILTGFGFGIVMPIHTIAVQNTVPYSIMGAATSAVTLLRNLGGLLGLAIVGSVMNSRFSSEFTSNLPSTVKEVVSPGEIASIVDNPQALVDVEAQDQLRSLFEGLGTQGAALFEQTLETLRNALNSALMQIFTVLLVAAVLAVIINLFLKGIPSHRHKLDEPGTTPGD
jgi:hypothetical protein